MIEVILFDWGGTLVDVSGQPAALLEGARQVAEILTGQADPALAQALAMQAMAAEKSAAADPSHREVDLEAVLRTWSASHGCPADDGRINAAVEAIGACWLGRALKPIPGAIETLAELRTRGLRMGLVSNVWIPQRFCRQELHRQGLQEHLDTAVFSSQMGYRKPAYCIYEEALSGMFPQGRPADLSNVLFVGDSPVHDVAGPAKLGMRTALVDSVPGFWSPTDLAAAHPDLRLQTVAELPGKLEDLT